MIADKLGYSNVANTTKVVKSTPCGFFGLTATVAGNVTIYDNASAASGTVLYAKTGLTAGEVVQFGGNGISANSGLVVVATATVNILYT